LAALVTPPLYVAAFPAEVAAGEEPVGDAADVGVVGRAALSAVDSEHRLGRVDGKIRGNHAHVAIAPDGEEAAATQLSQPLQRRSWIELPVVRRGPGDRPVVVDFQQDQDVRDTVFPAVGGLPLHALEGRSAAERHEVVCILVETLGRLIDRRDLGKQPLVVRTVPRFVTVEGGVEFLVAEIRQQFDAPAEQGPSILGGDGGCREDAAIAMVLRERGADLLHAVDRVRTLLAWWQGSPAGHRAA
jgi:hypothetical protein